MDKKGDVIQEGLTQRDLTRRRPEKSQKREIKGGEARVVRYKGGKGRQKPNYKKKTNRKGKGQKPPPASPGI